MKYSGNMMWWKIKHSFPPTKMKSCDQDGGLTLTVLSMADGSKVAPSVQAYDAVNKIVRNG